jgi:precorrin-4/cobalt-precorrin-4 C11-methyltransferase
MIRFVGAGPGAADLITLRGQRALAGADVVIYAGSLVNPELLEYCGRDCAVHNSAGLTLEEVVALMADAAAQGKTVVRLHTGDPSIYGAVREQMDALEARGIPYEVVPGVSSFLGAAAALRAEFTLPGVSQTVILTRMEGRTPVPREENIASLASHRASMAIFLSASMLEGLAAELLAGGYAPDTPAAVVYKATWADERVLRTTVAELPGLREEVSKTALVFVGGFLGNAYERSKLYDPAFSHGFRKGGR